MRTLLNTPQAVLIAAVALLSAVMIAGCGGEDPAPDDPDPVSTVDNPAVEEVTEGNPPDSGRADALREGQGDPPGPPPEPNARPAPPFPEAERADITEVGDVIFVPATDDAPARVMVRGRSLLDPAHATPTELAVTTPTGKTHEALFSADARAVDVNTALSMLGLREGVPFVPGETLEECIPPKHRGAGVAIEARWVDADGNAVTHRVESCLRTRGGGVMPRTAFVYLGGDWREGMDGNQVYVPEVEGLIATTWWDRNAILDNPNPEGVYDETYAPNPDVLPLKGTPVVVIFTVEEPQAGEGDGDD